MVKRFAIAVVVLVAIGVACKKKNAEPTAEDYPMLVGSWFVRYASDPLPYLDVAVDDHKAGIKGVTADLTSPSRVHENLAMMPNDVENPEWENEWRYECRFLEEKLEEGIWYVSRVRIEAKDDSWSEFTAPNHYDAYRYRHGNARGQAHDNMEASVEPGALYVTETQTGHPIFYISTFASKDGTEGYPVLRVFKQNDTKAWLAKNEEPDAYVKYPRVALPLVAGETYLIEVTSREPVGVNGHYGIVVNDKEFTTRDNDKAAVPDKYEPDDTPADAKPIAVDDVQSHSFSTRTDGTHDVDWLVFRVPENP
ncbi:MAG: hypothetical protein M5R36_14075 [Deltaproteobacteria bacterium]|nr:hypothetical protein [Deltaproteobacteria bacterium]